MIITEGLQRKEWTITNRQRTIDPAAIEGISQNLIAVMSLLHKYLPRRSVMDNDHATPLSHVQVLSLLGETGALSVSEISRKVCIVKPNITPLVDRLVEEGLVDRVRDTEDRRVVNIVLLDAGREKLAAIKTTIGGQVQDWVQNINSADLREMADSLGTLNRILSQRQKSG